MHRRDILKTALAGATALAAPRVVHAEGAKTINFTPHADLASLDPVWTTADITRNFSLAVYDTLYGYDAQFNVQPQMVEGTKTENDGKLWELTLRDGLKFHDGTPVLAKDCVATIQRFSKRYPFGQALMSRTDEITAPSDKVIRFRLNKPFALLPNALAEVYCGDHAGTPGHDRPDEADHRGDRQRTVQVRRIGTHSRSARGVREE